MAMACLRMKDVQGLLLCEFVAQWYGIGMNVQTTNSHFLDTSHDFPQDPGNHSSLDSPLFLKDGPGRTIPMKSERPVFPSDLQTLKANYGRQPKTSVKSSIRFSQSLFQTNEIACP